MQVVRPAAGMSTTFLRCNKLFGLVAVTNTHTHTHAGRSVLLWKLLPNFAGGVVESSAAAAAHAVCQGESAA